MRSKHSLGESVRFGDERPGPAFWQIGTDGGLLDYPVQLKDGLFLAPAERADVIIDFANFQGKTLTLTNSAKAPYPAGTRPDPQTNGQIMQLRVVNTLSSASLPGLDITSAVPRPLPRVART
ncbi:MAG: hypothetical protein M1608_14195 [Candidatus Omnitrophica bacterium]|nr:hypothetical protein [Candidatus Omnitrophota bacterium]